VGAEVTAAGPLEGVRVIDLTHALAGPFCTMLLADLGADVLKVEPLHGDGTRKLGPFAPGDELKAFGAYFHSVNRNKRSTAINLGDPAGRQVFERLLDGADVLVENYRDGVMDRFGLSYEVLHNRFPRLVYACIRGFGDHRTGDQALPPSPYAEWPAFDVVAQAMGGLTGVTGPGPDRPMNAGAPLGDMAPALFCALGIVSAVLHARETGRGQLVDVAMYDAVLAICERIVYIYSYSGQVAVPQGAGNPQLCPFDAFPTRDGWITIAAPGERHWQYLCDAMGNPELGVNPELASNQQRVARADEVRRIVGEWTSRHSTREVEDLLGGLVPCGPVNTAADIFVDPHVARRQMLSRVEHPGMPGLATIVNSPIRMTESHVGVRHRAPLLGEHTDEVFAAIGFDAEEVARLRAQGVIA